MIIPLKDFLAGITDTATKQRVQEIFEEYEALKVTVEKPLKNLETLKRYKSSSEQEIEQLNQKIKVIDGKDIEDANRQPTGIKLLEKQKNKAELIDDNTEVTRIEALIKLENDKKLEHSKRISELEKLIAKSIQESALINEKLAEFNNKKGKLQTEFSQLGTRESANSLDMIDSSSLRQSLPPMRPPSTYQDRHTAAKNVFNDPEKLEQTLLNEYKLSVALKSETSWCCQSTDPKIKGNYVIDNNGKVTTTAKGQKAFETMVELWKEGMRCKHGPDVDFTKIDIVVTGANKAEILQIARSKEIGTNLPGRNLSSSTISPSTLPNTQTPSTDRPTPPTPQTTTSSPNRPIVTPRVDTNQPRLDDNAQPIRQRRTP